MKFGLIMLLVLFPIVAWGATPGNTLTWKVTDEKGVFGYIVYRSEQRSGPFLRISREIVRKNDVPVSDATAGRYRFEDKDVEPGRSYHYFIDVISVHGLKQRLTGVQTRRVDK